MTENDMLMAALAAAETEWGDALVLVSIRAAEQTAAHDAFVEATRDRATALAALAQARSAVAGRLR